MNPFVNAKPIWVDDGGVVNVYAAFETRFAAGEKQTLLRVAAESHYAIYLNGEYVYAYQYPDDERLRVFDEIDLSARVRPGENELTIRCYCAKKDSFVYIRGHAYVMFEVFADGESRAHSDLDTLCALDERYARGDAALISPQLGFTFDYDATKPIVMGRNAVAAGEIPPFTSRPIEQCAMGERVPGRLVAQGVYCEREGAKSLGQRMQYAYLSFMERRALETDGLFASDAGEGIYMVYDLGRNEVGLMDVELTVDEDTEVLIGWGEHLDDLRVRSYVGIRNFCARYVAAKGRSRFFHPHRRIGGRYIQLFVRAHRVQLHYAGLRPLTYPLPQGAHMELEDALHQRIYDTCLRTLEMCMHEHYEDCPWREQALYAMDSRNQMLIGYYAFGEYRFAQASLRLLGRTLRPDGLLELCAPSRADVNIPSFSMMYVVALWENLLFSGDRAFAREMLPVAETIVKTALARVRDDGLVARYAGKWNFYEWSEGLDGHLEKGVNVDEDRLEAPLSAFVILAARALAKIEREFERAEESDELERKAERMAKAAHRAYYDAENARYFSFMDANGRSGLSELTQALCVVSGICPDGEVARVCKSLTSGDLVPATLAYTAFKYDALLSRAEGYGDWVRRDVETQWGKMLFAGATSFWETIDGADAFDNAGSLCHGWSAVPAYLYFAYGLGVAPEKPGWDGTVRRPVDGMPRVKSAAIRLYDGSVRNV